MAKFTIKRSNLSSLKKQKEDGQKIPRTAPADPKATDENDTPKPAKAIEPAEAKPKVDVRYQKRQPLTAEESTFLKQFYYEKSGYTGRDALYKQLQTHYDSKDTPKDKRISRRRMYKWLEAQEVHQLHAPMRKSSVAIKPIVAKEKLSKLQADLIIKKGNPNHVAILSVVDVASRKVWVAVLKSTTSKAVASGMQNVPQRIDCKPKTVYTDNGAEFVGDEFQSLLKKKGISHIFNIAYKASNNAIVERFNGNLQASMGKEETATGAKWWAIAQKHCRLYNTKPNRMLRIMQNDTSTYKTYTPNELFEAEPSVLKELYEAKNTDLKQAGKIVKEFSIGDTVRVANMSKRKDALAKGHTTNWSKELYSIYKSSKPKKKVSTKPILYYVKSKDTGERLVGKTNGRLLGLTANDIQRVGDVQKAPAKMKVGKTASDSESDTDEPAGVKTRAQKKATGIQTRSKTK